MSDRLKALARAHLWRALVALIAFSAVGGLFQTGQLPIQKNGPVPSLHRFGAYKGTTAKFTINGVVSTPPGFDASNSQTLTFQLETNPAPDIYQTQFSIYDPNNPSSPLASFGAPTLTLSPSTGIPTTPTGTVTVQMPASGAHSYKVRAVVNGGVQASTGQVIPTWTFERIISIRSANGLRKQIPGEATEYTSRGWSDEQNRQVDAVDSLGGAGVSVGAPVADLAALRAVTSSNRVDNQTRAVGSPVGTWIFSISSGANFTDDGKTIVRPNDVILAAAGRWYNTAAAPTVPTIAALRAAVSGKHDRVRVLAYSTLGDGGGDEFYWDSTSSALENSGTIITPTGAPATGRWMRQHAPGMLKAAWFGAKGDCVHITGVSITSGTNTFTKSGFSAADIGKRITIYGAGASQATLSTTVSNVSGTTVTIGTNASNTLPDVPHGFTAGDATYCTDDTAAIQAALNVITLVIQGGTVSFNMEGNGGQYGISSTLTLGASSIGVRLVADRRTRDHTNAQLIWMGALNGTLMQIRASHAGLIESLGFDGNSLADYGLQFLHRVGDTVVEHWNVKNTFHTNALVANLLIGEAIGTTPPAGAGDESSIIIDNAYFLQSFVGAKTTYHLLQRSPNAVGNSCVGCQFGGDNTYPTYGADIQSGTFTFSGIQSVGSGSFDLLVDADGTNVPAGVGVFGWITQSKQFAWINTQSSPAATQYAIEFSNVAHSDIVGSGTYGMRINVANFSPVVLTGCRFTHNVTIDNTTTGWVYSHGTQFDLISNGNFSGKTSQLIGTWGVWPNAYEQFGGALGALNWDSSSAISIGQAQRSGTGANAGANALLASQQGQNVAGGTNNSGGNVLLTSGVAGTGGTGGLPGYVGLGPGGVRTIVAIPSVVALANGASPTQIAPGTANGFLFVSDNGNTGGSVLLQGGAAAVSTVFTNGGVYTTTCGNAGTINICASGGVYKLENRRYSPGTFTLAFMGSGL